MPSLPELPARLVALGASNLTRGLPTLLRACPSMTVYGALGHGRSYGIPSQFWGRGLPGIRDCGIWKALERGPKTRALVTDVGNDILYGVPAPRILSWVGECIDRLEGLGAEVVLTDLPLESVGRLAVPAFLVIRSLFFRRATISLPEVQERAVAVNEGLVALAASGSRRLVRLRPEWYLGDPIHIRPRFWRAAWREILGDAPLVPQRVNPARAYWARPEKQTFLGLPFGGSQPALRFRRGGALFLY